ncbi:hypothetical protein [Agrobacterium pusense]|uniref:phage major capsid protein n=1 Tax=Agrobacterium pusense TaxID=648995 RepID=UPI00244B8FA8|nr:hypothetical protein [Agrobacterium pusense]MDH0872146.1 hypothetical protein [Agrobacterium pusense]
MKKAAYVFATVAAIVCFGLAFTILSADPSHAASLLGHDAFVQTRGLLDHVYQATPALLALRAKATDLTTRAESKRAELVEGLSDEAARAIEKDHSAILTELDGVRAEITALENAERNAPTPSESNPQAIAQSAVRAERERVTAIEELAERAGHAGFGRDHIRSGTSLDSFRGLLLDHLVTSERAAPTDSRVRVHVGNDEADTIRSARVEALAYGLGAPVPQGGPSAAARQYMGQGLVDIAADCVNFHGRRMLNARDIDNIFSRAAHSTSDFPVIFEGAVNRTLEQRYALAQPTFKRFARKKNFRDFRPDTIVKTGDFPMLEKILENGKIKFGSFGEGKEAVQAFSYAIALNISRQMLINDDLGAIAELLTSYGASVALFEEVTFYGGAYNGKLADGKTVFHADHKNLAAAGSAITVDSVGEGRKSMGRQTSLDGKPLLANPARIMLVGPNQLTDAEKLLASITPATVSTVNIFSGKFELVETSQIADN